MDKSSKLADLKLAAAVAAIVVAGALGGCDNSNKTAGQQLDTAIAKTREQAGKAEQTAGVALREAGNGLKSAADKTSDAAGDATITATVKSSFVKEPGLSATSIDVSTDNGVVTLKGNVDNETSRKTAIQLATGVEGVRGVNDQLKVGSS